MRRWPLAVLGALLTALAVFFAAECDDCYFAYWQFDSLWDFLLVRPDQSLPAVIGVPLNGRHVGNFLGVLLARLHASPLGLLRAPLMAGGMLALVVLLAQTVTSRKLPLSRTLPVAAALVIFAPKGLWQQVYSWGSAFANYLLPVVVLLALLLWMRRGTTRPWEKAALFLLALISTQFIEHMTLFLLVSAGGWLAWVVLLKQKPALPDALAVFFGSAVGALLMFCDPRYGQKEGKIHFFGLSDVQEKLGIIAEEALLRPIPLAIGVSVLLLWVLVRTRSTRQLGWLAALVPCHGLILARQIQMDVFGLPQYQPEGIALGAVLLVCWLGMAGLLPSSREKVRILWLAAGLCVVNGSLLVASPLTSRMFFASYILLSMVALELYHLLCQSGVRGRSGWLWGASFAAVLLLFGIYGTNYQVYQQRIQLAQAQVDQGATEVTLPLVPFPAFTTNEMVGKGDLSYRIYREQPWDVAFTFQPYTQWSGDENAFPFLRWAARIWP